MTGGDRIGPRAFAWSEADRDAICHHLIRLLVAFETALMLLKNTAYSAHMKELLDDWRDLLEAVPPDKPPQT